MHRYRVVDTVVRTCRLSGQLQEKSFSSKNLSKLRKHDLEDNRISFSTVGSEANKVFSLRLSTESNTDMKAEQRASPQRGHKFSRVCTAACIAQFPSVAQGYWWLPRNIQWGFCCRARSLQSTPPLWQLHQSRMKSTCLLCSLRRMHDGWSTLTSNFQPSIKAAPQQCPQKAHFKISRVCTAACEDFLRRNAWRNFRGFRHRVWPTFEPPQRSTVERFLKIC